MGVAALLTTVRAGRGREAGPGGAGSQLPRTCNTGRLALKHRYAWQRWRTALTLLIRLQWCALATMFTWTFVALSEALWPTHAHAPNALSSPSPLPLPLPFQALCPGLPVARPRPATCPEALPALTIPLLNPYNPLPPHASPYPLLPALIQALFLGRLSPRESQRLSQRLVKHAVLKLLLVGSVVGHIAGVGHGGSVGAAERGGGAAAAGGGSGGGGGGLGGVASTPEGVAALWLAWWVGWVVWGGVWGGRPGLRGC